MDIAVIGPRIKFLRESKGLSQDDVIGKAKGMAVKTLSRLESGDGNPTLSTIQTLAEAIGVHSSDILFGAEPTAPQAQIDFRDAAGLLSKFSGAPRDIQNLVLTIVYRDKAYLQNSPRDFRQKATSLLKAVLSL